MCFKSQNRIVCLAGQKKKEWNLNFKFHIHSYVHEKYFNGEFHPLDETPRRTRTKLQTLGLFWLLFLLVVVFCFPREFSLVKDKEVEAISCRRMYPTWSSDRFPAVERGQHRIFYRQLMRSSLRSWYSQKSSLHVKYHIEEIDVK